MLLDGVSSGSSKKDGTSDDSSQGEQDPKARGRENEKKVLEDMGLEKNTQKVSTDEGNSIPDALTEEQSIEIKDTKSVYNTKQVRIQTEAAAEAGKESVLVTGENTHVSNTAEQSYDTIIRRTDIGPQQ